jgi:hypothetical protein
MGTTVDLTMEAWVKTTSNGGYKVAGFENAQTGTGAVNSDRQLWVGTDGKARFGNYNGTATEIVASAGTVNDGNWHHLVGYRNSANNTIGLHVDGGSPETAATTGVQSYTGYFRIGSYRGGTWTAAAAGYFNGSVDEVRIVGTARDQAWVTTTYNSINDPATFATFGAEEPRWYSTNWSYRKPISIDYTKVDGALTNFPVLISRTDADLITKARSDGFDIMFTSVDGMTKLAHERETYDSATGELVAWVEVPSVSNTANTKLWMYYGYSAATDQQNVGGTWDGSNYVAVYHLKEDPSGGAPQFLDSRGGFNGTATSMVAGDQSPGKIGKSINFDGTAKYISTSTGATLKGKSSYTISAWAVVDNLGIRRTIYEEPRGGTAAARAKLSLEDDNTFGLGGRDFDGEGFTEWAASAATVERGPWYHVAGVFNSSDTHSITLNGTKTTSVVAADSVENTVPVSAPKIGIRYDANGERWDGKIDEVRVSDTARSDPWITAEYRNQESPSTFYAVGSEQARLLAAHTIWWQVVEFTNAADILVQHGASSLASGSASTSSTLGTAVNRTRSFVLSSFSSSGTGISIGRRALRTHLSADNTVTTERSVTGDAIEEIRWQVVELKDGSRVQYGSATFAEGDGSEDAALIPVDTTRTTAFASVSFGGGAAMGETDYVTDDILGAATATVTVTSSTNVQLVRTSVAGTTEISWFVVEWGGPVTASTAWASWSMRRTLTVSASTAAPTAYTTSATFDHAAMVTAGLSLASGNDVRVVRWTGAAWVELDRVLDDVSSWNSATTKIWFRTAAAVSASSTDFSYYLFYGNPAAGAPPATKTNVYTFSDGFETGDTSSWSGPGGGGGGGPSNWYDALWTKRKLITLTAGQISGTQTNFPVLISITDAALAAAQADADDLLFTDGDGTTKLNHQVERFTQGSGILTAWVKKPSLSAASNTMYLYYGNAAATSQQNATAVWDSSFAAVYHLAESVNTNAGNFKDSTSNARNGTYSGAGLAVADGAFGQTGGSLLFDGSDPIATSNHTSGATALTASAWVYYTNTTNSNAAVGRYDGTNGSSWALEIDDTGGTNTPYADIRTTEQTYLPGSQNVTSSAWTLLTMTYTGSNMYLYKNGVQIGTTTKTGGIANTTASVYLGSDESDTSTCWCFMGRLDEIRVSTAARAASWITTEYNNQSNPASFTTVGGEETQSVSSSTWYNSLWQFRKKITLTSGSISSGPHTDFPVLISISGGSYPELTDRTKTQADFDDILFTSSNGTTKLAHEIERYDSSTGVLVAWVKMPSLAVATNELYMYYGNSSATNQQNVAPVASTVWSNSYLAVYHFEQDPAGGTLTDSTSNARHGTVAGGTTPAREDAKIGRGWHFSPADNSDYVSLPAMGNQTAATVETWLYVDAFTDANAGLVSRNGWTTGSVHFKANSPNMVAEANGGGVASSVAVNTATWYRGAYSYTRLNVSGLKLYKNADAPVANLTGDHDWQGTGLEIGHEHTDYTLRQFDGLTDEVRISSIARSDGWIATEYNNQNNPAAFHTFAAEEFVTNAFAAATDQKRSGTYALKVSPVASANLLIANGVSQANVQFDAWWRLSTTASNDIAQGVRMGATAPTNAYEGTTDATAKLRTGKSINGTYTNFATAAANTCPSSGAWAKVSVLVQGTDMRVLCNGAQVAPQADGTWSATGSELTSGSVGFRATAISGGQNWWIDDVTARVLVNPEPAVTVGSVVDRP